MPTVVDELLTFLFDGQPHALAQSMASWLAASRRFTAFVAENQSKIRKKLRTAQDPDSLGDLRLELETAHLLLGERSLNVVYEPQHPEHARRPDFAVRYTTSHLFMVEVTRLRTMNSSGDRFSETLCSKLGQLLPQCSNLLIVGADAPPPALRDLSAALLHLQLRVEANDPAIVNRHGIRGRTDFFRRYRRLSALLVRATPLRAGSPGVIWVNPQAQHLLPARVHAALARSHSLERR